MKMICIKNQIIHNKSSIGDYSFVNVNKKVTVGKIYEIIYDHKYDVFIKNDDGVRTFCPKPMFMSIEEYRDVKLKELGI